MSDQLLEDVKKVLSEMGPQYKKLSEDVASYGKGATETKTKLDKLTDEFVSLSAKFTTTVDERLAGVEQRLVELPQRFAPPKTLGEQFIESPDLLAAVKSGNRRINVSATIKGPLETLAGMKDIQVGLTTQWPQQLPNIPVGARLPFGVRPLIPSGRTTSGSLQYIRELSIDNQAKPVAEGAAKPKSNIVYEVKTAPVETIAHYFKVTKQTFEDLPFLASLINQTGIYMLKLKEDDQLLNGSGVTPNLQGFNPLAGAAPAPPAGPPASTLVDAIGAAVFDLAGKGRIADGTVVNGGDWGHVAMLKNVQGNYIFANPMDYTSGGKIWGTTLAVSYNQPAGTFLVGQFQGASMLVDREDVNVSVANQNEDDFIHNMYTVLIEERLANLIFMPGAFEKGVVPAAGVGAERAERGTRI